MAFFRRSKPVVFNPYAYQSRRARWQVPRWLVILLIGIALGAGGLYFIQERYGPPRLSVEAAERLQARLAELEQQGKTLQANLNEATQQRDAAQAESKRRTEAAQADVQRLTKELAASRQTVDKLRTDLALFELALPPDPRGGAIGVRAARFSRDGGQLGYHVLLTRDREAGGKAFKGIMQIVVAGQRPGGRNDTITLDPLTVAVDEYLHLQGKLSLPEGFVARQTTVRVLDRLDGQQFGMRVFNVRD